jgi:hypothetical protein
MSDDPKRGVVVGYTLMHLADNVSSHRGLCHCRAVGFVYETALAPEVWAIRACQCTFCRAHGALSTSDPKGSLQFVEQIPNALRRYRFGQKTADFLLCRDCGVYLGAMLQLEGKAFGVINVRVLNSLVDDLREPEYMSYDHEGPAARRARRESRWTPIKVAHA